LPAFYSVEDPYRKKHQHHAGAANEGYQDHELIIQLLARRQQLNIAKGVDEKAVAYQYHKQKNKQTGVYFIESPGEDLNQYIAQRLLH
jgi:hypothetical protein